jgi:hypothetical protein
MPVSSRSARKEARKGRPSGAARAASRTPKRAKLSTTVAAENFTFLETLVNSGRTDSIAEAVDLAVGRLRREENRKRLERATAEYFASLTPEAQTEEDALAHQLHTSAGGVNVDLEP